MQKLILQPAHDRNHQPIAHQVIPLIVVLGQRVTVRDTHQPRCLARRQKSRLNHITVDDEYGLATRPASWRSQATTDLIEADLCSLDFLAVFVQPGPPVNRADDWFSQATRLLDLSKIRAGHETKQP